MALHLTLLASPSFLFNMRKISISEQLHNKRINTAKQEDKIIDEVNKILNRDLFHEKKILNHLQLYNKSFELLDEEDDHGYDVFDTKTIKDIAINYRLRFVDSQHYKKDIPYEAVLKIKHLNSAFKKDLKGFKIMATSNSFKTKNADQSVLIFAPTNHGNYCLIHQWGSDLKWNRKATSWPMKKFETLFCTIAFVSMILAISLPTRLIWLPEHSDYWGMYRVGAFMHILIFNMGFTTYAVFAFGKNFSSSNWKRIG